MADKKDKQEGAKAGSRMSRAKWLEDATPIQVTLEMNGVRSTAVGKPRGFSSGKVGYNVSEKVQVDKDGERAQLGLNLVVIGSDKWND
jgi:hypothetical protein